MTEPRKQIDRMRGSNTTNCVLVALRPSD